LHYVGRAGAICLAEVPRYPDVARLSFPPHLLYLLLTYRPAHPMTTTAHPAAGTALKTTLLGVVLVHIEPSPV
jgi:hypothetical protein